MTDGDPEERIVLSHPLLKRLVLFLAQERLQHTGVRRNMMDSL